MNTAILVLLAIATIVGIIFYFSAHNKKGKPPANTKNPYKTVSIKWHMNACDAVKNLHGKRFMGSDAPSFPLPECDVAQCDCRYQFHGDRREGERRLPGTMNESLLELSIGEDKRSTGDRRTRS